MFGVADRVDEVIMFVDEVCDIVKDECGATVIEGDFRGIIATRRVLRSVVFLDSK